MRNIKPKPKIMSQSNTQLVTIGLPWTNAIPCNNHLYELAEYAREELEGKEDSQNSNAINTNSTTKTVFANAPVVSDGMTNGLPAMRYSLPSRDLIADSIEMTHESYMSDALLAFCGCDKTIPAVLLAAARTNSPSIIVYGGTALPPPEKYSCDSDSSSTKKKTNDSDPTTKSIPRYEDVGEATGAFSSQEIDAEQLYIVEKEFRVGSGSCAGFFTANTMAVMAEVLGLSLPKSSTCPAVSKSSKSFDISIQKRIEVEEAVKRLKDILNLNTETQKERMERDNILPHSILTREAFENAVTVLFAMGGSTNAVLHLLALAKEVERNSGMTEPLLQISDFTRIAKKTPLIANLSPRGPYWVSELHEIGGVPLVLRELLKHNLINGSCMTITGKSIKENLKDLIIEESIYTQTFVPNPIIHSITNPVAPPNQHIRILWGSLAPDSAVSKAKGIPSFKGPAVVFNSEKEAFEAIMKQDQDGGNGKNVIVKKGDVVVIRNEGPAGAPGMPEMLAVTSALVGKGLDKYVAVVTGIRRPFKHYVLCV